MAWTAPIRGRWILSPDSSAHLTFIAFPFLDLEYVKKIGSLQIRMIEWQENFDGFS